MVSWLYCKCWSICLAPQLPFFSTKKVKHVTFSYWVWSATTTYSCFLGLFQVTFSCKRKVEEKRGKVVYFKVAKPPIWPSLVCCLPGGVCTEQSWSLLLPPASQLCRLEQSAPAEGKNRREPASPFKAPGSTSKWIGHTWNFILCLKPSLGTIFLAWCEWQHLQLLLSRAATAFLPLFSGDLALPCIPETQCFNVENWPCSKPDWRPRN